VPALDLGDRKVEYSIVKGASRRYTYFRFRPDMTLEVVLPRGRKVDVEREIRARLGWIARESERMAKSKNVLGRDRVLVRGKALQVVFYQGSKEEFAPDFDGGLVTVRGHDRRIVRELLRRWFLRETSSYVVAKVAELAPKMGVRPAKVDVREIGKWGYCTRGGRLSFSWQLAALPDTLREYVVIHELAHLVEFSHSPAFRSVLRRFCPDFHEREKELDLVVPYDRLGAPA
jgi:predicted metal-dependent hydrolase